MHDFRSRPLQLARGFAPRAPGCEGNISSGHAIAPYDFAAIYNVAALWNLGFDGTSQSIAIVGRTNINAGAVAAFRTNFGLPGNDTQIIGNGRDPGADAEIEADLNVEWAGEVATGAAIQLVVSASTMSTDGVVLSSWYIVDNNLADVVSLSFGACEEELGTATNSSRASGSRPRRKDVAVRSRRRHRICRLRRATDDGSRPQHDRAGKQRPRRQQAGVHALQRGGRRDAIR